MQKKTQKSDFFNKTGGYTLVYLLSNNNEIIQNIPNSNYL